MYKIFSSWLFYFMSVHLIALMFLFVINLKDILSPFKKISKKTWSILLLIFIIGFCLRNSQYWLGPHTDGFVFQESANYWLNQGEFVKCCALGNIKNCLLYEQVLFLAGYPFLISLVSILFGFHSLNGPIISAVLGSLTIIIIFLISYLIFNKKVGLYASLIFSLLPLNIIHSQTGSSRPTYLFFVGLTILFYFIALRANKLSLWILTVLSLSYSIYVRQENYILLPLLLFFLVLFKWEEIRAIPKNFSLGKTNYKYILYAFALVLLFLIIQIPALYWLLHNNPYIYYDVPGIFGLYYKRIPYNVQLFLKQFFNIIPFSPIEEVNQYSIFATFLFFVGFILIILSTKVKYIFILSLFLLYLIFYASFSVDNLFSDDYVRRSLFFHLPYAIIAAYTWDWIGNRIKKRIRIKKEWILSFLALALIFTSHLSFPRALFKDARGQIGFNKDYFLAVSKTPKDSIIITTRFMVVTNDYFKDNQRRAIDIDLISPENKDMFLNAISEEIKKNYEIFYFEDYRCQMEHFDYACQFINTYLEKEHLFDVNRIKVYKITLKI
ncbi:MAG: glycosyltransferase family 39 protein [Candidatus Nealsonbacteria bacterium]|nr:MAG: glycosyltransferase family 39 protein [Candidatus Nealsonbacteria bacterium]